MSALLNSVKALVVLFWVIGLIVLMLPVGVFYVLMDPLVKWATET